MNSLCNIIKSEDVKIVGIKTIKNFVDIPQIESENVMANKLQIEEEILKKEAEIALKLEEANMTCENMINEARLESEKIKEISKDEALNIEKKAYEEGHAQGMKNGYEDGYKEVYEENIEKAKLESEEIITNANKILFESNKALASFMNENKSNILELSINIAEKFTRMKFEDSHVMNEMIEKVITDFELRDNFIIKINPFYKVSVKQQIYELKDNYKINKDVFVITDERIEKGNVRIETPKGAIEVGIDSILDKIKEELI